MKQLYKIMTLSATMMIPVGVFAATDGTLNATSTGTVDITAQVNDLVNISRLDDINVGALSASNLSATEDFCVYRNGTGNYQITASGSGTANAFTVTEGTIELPYDVQINGSAVTAGTPLTGQTGANTTSLVCGGTDNADLEISFAINNVAAASTGTYSGTLTLTVAPE